MDSEPTGHAHGAPGKSVEEGKGPRSPTWPVRLVIYGVLVLIALLAIRVIDGHVMARHVVAIRSNP